MPSSNESSFDPSTSITEGFNRAAVDREQRMIELKKEINAMGERLGQTAPYVVNESDPDRATAAFRNSEERSRLIVESARDYAIFSMDLERRVVSWNSGAERLLGYTEKEILGQSIDIIFTSEDRANAVPAFKAAKALQDGSCTNERWYVRKDGSRFWGSGTTARLSDAKGTTIGFLKILHDQTEQLQAQTLLERARDEAESATRAKDHFLAILSHELRTPLTPVNLALRRLVRRPDLDQAAKDALAMIQRNVDLESRLIDDLLDLTRISRGTLEIVVAPLDVHEVIRAAIEVVTPDIESKQQRLTLSLEAGHTRLKGDAARLQQVFWNVLRNASKFTPDAGEITVSSRNDAGRLLVEVRDSGIGFGPGEGQRIFEAFVQATSSGGRRFEGLGLGLAISRATVEAHGGVIRAESPGADQGAIFTIELPLATGD